MKSDLDNGLYKCRCLTRHFFRFLALSLASLVGSVLTRAALFLGDASCFNTLLDPPAASRVASKFARSVALCIFYFFILLVAAFFAPLRSRFLPPLAADAERFASFLMGTTFELGRSFIIFFFMASTLAELAETLAALDLDRARSREEPAALLLVLALAPRLEVFDFLLYSVSMLADFPLTLRLVFFFKVADLRSADLRFFNSFSFCVFASSIDYYSARYGSFPVSCR